MRGPSVNGRHAHGGSDYLRHYTVYSACFLPELEVHRPAERSRGLGSAGRSLACTVHRALDTAAVRIGTSHTGSSIRVRTKG